MAKAKRYCGSCGEPWASHEPRCVEDSRGRNYRRVPTTAKAVAFRLQEQANQMTRIPDPPADHNIAIYRHWAKVILSPSSTEAQIDEAVKLNIGYVDMFEPLDSDYNYARRVQMGTSY